MLFQAVVIFLPILYFSKFHVKGERSIHDIVLKLMAIAVSLPPRKNVDKSRFERNYVFIFAVEFLDIFLYIYTKTISKSRIHQLYTVFAIKFRENFSTACSTDTNLIMV